MAKYDSEYPDHPQHGLYEDEPYDEYDYSSSRRGQRIIIGIVALILVVIMIVSMLAEIQ